MIKSQYFLLSFSILFVVLKVIAVSTTSLNLYGDEAQYWLWSKNLAFGYYSKPPLLPWLIRLFGLIAGDTFFAIKLIPISLYCITSYLVFVFDIPMLFAFPYPRLSLLIIHSTFLYFSSMSFLNFILFEFSTMITGYFSSIESKHLLIISSL